MFLFIISFLFLSHTVLSTIVDVRWLTLQSLLSAIRPLCLPAYCHCYAFICHTQGCQVFRAMYFVFVVCVLWTPYYYLTSIIDTVMSHIYIILYCFIFIHLLHQDECRTYIRIKLHLVPFFSYYLVGTFLFTYIKIIIIFKILIPIILSITAY